MKRILLLLLVFSLVFSATGLVGCRRDATDTEATTTDDVAEGDTILFGGALAMTGDNAPFDQMGLNGVLLAIDKVNEEGGILGKQVEWKNLDSKSDPAVSGEVAKQLVDEGAVIIITSSDYDFGGPAAKVASANGIIGITASASDPKFGSHMLGDTAFTLSMWNTTMGASVAEYAYKEDGIRTVFMVTDPFISYTETLSQYFKESFEGQGGEVVYEDTIVHGKIDTAALLAHYKSLPEEPDAIWISAYPDALGPAIKEFRSSGIDVPIYGGDVLDDPELLEAWGPEYATNILYAAHSFLSEEAVPGFEEYRERYEAKFGTLDAPWSMAGWDVVMVLAEAMNATGTTDGLTVAQYMTTKTFNCLTGDVSWSSAEDGHEPDKAACLVRLIDGVPTFVMWKKPDVLPRP
ncbi:MAG: ABC transporter substrate-binding protein [Coriobacteriia bacterium]|nr:ABC transporter substrate-binding protein [Coriobacteriia bacterium]